MALELTNILWETFKLKNGQTEYIVRYTLENVGVNETVDFTTSELKKNNQTLSTSNSPSDTSVVFDITGDVLPIQGVDFELSYTSSLSGAGKFNEIVNIDSPRNFGNPNTSLWIGIGITVGAVVILGIYAAMRIFRRNKF